MAFKESVAQRRSPKLGVEHVTLAGTYPDFGGNAKKLAINGLLTRKHLFFSDLVCLY
jgi:hypothetical protein